MAESIAQDQDRLLRYVAWLEHWLDAYKRAKAENDERYMLERDEARAEVARLTAAIRAEVDGCTPCPACRRLREALEGKP